MIIFVFLELISVNLGIILFEISVTFSLKYIEIFFK